MKMKKFAILALIFLGLISVFYVITKEQENKNLALMNSYKELVEKSYDGQNFNLQEVMIDDSLTYSIVAKKDKIIFKNNGLAAKGRKYTGIILTVKKDENGFHWSCIKDLVLFTTNC